VLLDVISAHPKTAKDDLQLQSIDFAYLLPNMTSVLQPMDLRIIDSLKQHYRKDLVLCNGSSKSLTGYLFKHSQHSGKRLANQRIYKVERMGNQDFDLLNAKTIWMGIMLIIWHATNKQTRI
jgi:DDE superfamily endonuclease